MPKYNFFVTKKTLAITVVIYLCNALIFYDYADDILLIAISVLMLQEMLNSYETELMPLDMRISVKNRLVSDVVNVIIRIASSY